MAKKKRTTTPPDRTAKANAEMLKRRMEKDGGIININPQQKVNPVPNSPTSAMSAADKPGDNARYLALARVALTLPRIDTTDAKQVEERCLAYLDFCMEHDMKPHLVGMATWLGVTRATLWNWKERNTNTAVWDVIQRMTSVMEMQWADYMQNGKINPASGIFLGKNWFGYRDEQAVTVKPDSNIDPGDADAARRKYLTGYVKENETSNGAETETSEKDKI